MSRIPWIAATGSRMNRVPSKQANDRVRARMVAQISPPRATKTEAALRPPRPSSSV
jgi:hypothetical protein